MKNNNFERACTTVEPRYNETLCNEVLDLTNDFLYVRDTECKENHFYSLPFGQAEGSIY